MSYRLCIYLVPQPAIDQAELLHLLQSGAKNLDHPLARPPIYAVLTSPERAASDGAWQFLIATEESWPRDLVCEYFLECLSPLPHTLLLHDDSNGQYVFRHYHPDTLFALSSDGPCLYGNVDRITQPYPQQGYSHAALQALYEKPESELSPAERAATMGYMNAVSLGLRQFYPRPLRYLDLCYHERGFLLSHPKRAVRTPSEVKLPARWRSYAAPHSDRDPSYAPPPLRPETQARRWAELGNFYDDPEQKIRCYTASLERQPGEPLVLYNLACAYASRGDRTAMLATLREACQAAPSQGADALADKDFAEFVHDPEFRRIVQPEVAVPSEALWERILNIDWAADPTPHRMSRIALLREFLRRMALWAEALGCPERWPFFDVAAQAMPEVPAPEVDLSSLPHLQARIQATLHWMLRWDALPHRPHPELPDPFEPLLLLYERGGGFTVENKLIDVGLAAIPCADAERYRTRPPMPSLSRVHLEELDREPHDRA